MKTSLRARLMLGFCLLLLPSGALHAQATKLYVASTGNDANDGSRGNPKRNFQAAHDGLAAGGEVVALDTAGYGALAIAKSVTITCPPGVTGLISVSASGATAITVNAGANDIVALRGLTIENTGGSSGASYGINVANVGTLNVSDCVIQGFTFIGVNFTSSSPASLFMTRCKLRNCSNNALVAGVNGVALTTTFEGCQFESCGEGITTYFSTKVMAHDCVAARNYTGFSVSNGASGVLLACTAANNKNTGVNGAGGTLTLQGCAIFNNPTGVDAGVSGQISLLNCSISSNNVGINADGGGAAVRLDACAITDNATAYNISNSQAATISSRGNNTVAHNTATGSIGTYAPQ
ncbi:MAG: hypothetical protein JO117_00465 [Verrucomicrobia bacterium]|nr:hypothetical protein [Verrucomicrobiota bacterium]